MLKNVKIRKRMIASFVIVILLSVSLACMSIIQLQKVMENMENLYSRPFQVVDKTWDIRDSLSNIRGVLLYAVILTTEEETRAEIEKVQPELAMINTAADGLRPIFANDETPQRAQEFESFMEKLEQMAVIRGKVEEKALRMESDEAMAILNNEYMPIFDQAKSQIMAISETGRSNAVTYYEKATKVGSDAERIVIVFSVIQVLVAIVIALVLTNGIVRPLTAIRNAAEEVAKGNIDIKIDYKSRDEIGNLAETFRIVISTLNLLNENMQNLKNWATEGRILERVKADERIEGAYQDIVDGVNGIMDTFGDHFNTIPIGVAIVDTSNHTLFANPTAEAYRAIDQENIHTQKKEFTDASGKPAGALIVTIDQTTVMEAQRESERQAANVAAQLKIIRKQSDYQKMGVGIIVKSLEKLAEGDLNIQMNDAPYDEDTKEIHDNFYELEKTLVGSCATIRSYIEELSVILAEVSDKNLDVGIDREYLGDFATLKTSINNIIDTLNEIFGEISSATNQVQGGSQQVANSSQSLAQGASEQASAVEEISSTITEVAEQTKSNAENAGKANIMSLEAKGDAEAGNRQMDEMVSAMEAIKEASRGIASIIKVIEDIAFQTNILALNAAVEAARAGEHGKGFAVVAEEVRTLAARSAAAAKETTEMIDNSLARVEVGSRIAGETAAALGKIVAGVTNTVDIVATIAEASAQQSIAISQIDNGIEQVSKVTQSNTAAAEEGASASEEMAGQAQMLQSMVSEFNLKGKKQSHVKAVALLAEPKS